MEAQQKELIKRIEGLQKILQGQVDVLMDDVEVEVESASADEDDISLKRLQKIKGVLEEIIERLEQGLNKKSD